VPAGVLREGSADEGPSAKPSEETPDQIPIAFPRSFGGNAAVMIESVTGFIRAAPRPCATRPATRTPATDASPQTNDAPVKTARPIMKTRRRPIRSATLPPVSMEAAKARV
jgi:hypothetical protein